MERYLVLVKYETEIVFQSQQVKNHFICFRSSRLKVFCKKDVLRNVTKSTGKQVFSCGFCDISQNIFFHRTPLVVASGVWWCIDIKLVIWTGYMGWVDLWPLMLKLSLFIIKVLSRWAVVILFLADWIDFIMIRSHCSFG